jgi:L-aminoadipate-semialdehyde dehydrogenase
VFIPLSRMPLNPNGKIDKPALPFPDTALTAPAKKSSSKMSPTEQAIHDIWLSILPAAPQGIELDDNFFDLGGHSILATRMVFELRKAFVVDVPLGLVFEKPTVRELAAQIEVLRHQDLGLPETDEKAGEKKVVAPSIDAAYAQDVEVLVQQLPSTFPSLPADFATKKLTVFLTGATGFLGAFILRDLLSLRKDRVGKVICLVRAKTQEDGIARLREGCQGRGVWDEQWVKDGKLDVVVGDLATEKFGLDAATWGKLESEIDSVIHNGAIVSSPHSPAFCAVS